ncbi:hypothetical protein EDB85DRAFT_1895315 [Lactarius pseudohatsudake]|nr:hypothetical protein EDB85DRAFT_1895315 [Lactarius pseudohatsudake]
MHSNYPQLGTTFNLVHELWVERESNQSLGLHAASWLTRKWLGQSTILVHTRLLAAGQAAQYRGRLILSDMPMSDNDEQCALRPDGTLKDASEIPWLNDPDDTEPIPAHGLGAPSLNVDSDASTTACLKGKEPARLVSGRRVIKPTAKAQQASLTGFFSTRTVLINGKESANSGNSSPAKQGSYNTTF